MSKRKFDEGLPPLSVLHKLIKPKDEELLHYVCAALNRLLKEENSKRETISTLIQAGICTQLAQLVVHPSTRVAISAAHIVGCIADTQEEALIQAIMNAKIISRFVYNLEHSDINLKAEVAWAISKILKGASYEQIRHLAEKGCIRACCEMLSVPEAETLSYCMATLSRILDMGMQMDYQVNGANPYLKSVTDCGGVDKLKTLRDDENNEDLVREEAAVILNLYFNEPQA